MAKLTLAQQRMLAKAIPRAKVMACRRLCKKSQMQGEGVSDIIKKIKKALGPIGKELGTRVIKEIIVPMIMSKAKQYAAGSGYYRTDGYKYKTPPKTKRRKPGAPKRRSKRGNGLKLAGQGCGCGC